MKKACKAGTLQAFVFIGAGNRNRTYDLRITNAPLYQLSYSGDNAAGEPAANRDRLAGREF
jgi:hypothetical protein